MIKLLDWSWWSELLSKYQRFWSSKSHKVIGFWKKLQEQKFLRFLIRLPGSSFHRKRTRNQKVWDSQMSAFWPASHFFEIFTAEWTKFPNLMHPNEPLQSSPLPLSHDKQIRPKVVMSCYRCSKNSKCQLSKEVERHSTLQFTALNLTQNFALNNFLIIALRKW